MRYLLRFLLFLGMSSCHLSLHAHPGDDGHSHDKPVNLRLWKDADGLFELEACFVVARDDKVLLARVDGSQIWMPLDRLSRPDRAWIAERNAAIQMLNELHFGASAPSHSLVSLGRASGWLAVTAIFSLGTIGSLVRLRSAAIPVAAVAFASLCILLVFVGSDHAQENKGPPPAIVDHFQAFKGKLQFRWNESTLFIDSNGLPDHPMMTGITNWQQQVPLPQPYSGDNAWQIPLKPRMAESPISAKKALYRGAIALAVNGVPIFNALNNRGEDAFKIGELDEFGGHCGKADDYHYHIAPLHLQKIVGDGNPIGYALDGFPLYGLTDHKLDEFNGRFDDNGNYRYHSTKTYPYINGGLKGIVQVRNDGVEPQPRAAPVREAQRPLRGARITDFAADADKKKFSLKYDVNGAKRIIEYKINANGSYTFTFVDESGRAQTETYMRREGKGPNDKGPDKKGDDKKKDDEKKKKGKGPSDNTKNAELLNRVPTTIFPKAAKLKVTSPAFEEGGRMPVEFTGDGDGVSPPLAWNGAPRETKAYALNLWHVPDPGGIKSYWVVYNIPATVTNLPKNAQGIGTIGLNDKSRPGYDPMKSKGPGAKEYHVTVFALSAEPKFRTDKVTRDELLDTIKDIVLAEGTLTYRYERGAKTD